MITDIVDISKGFQEFEIPDRSIVSILTGERCVFYTVRYPRLDTPKWRKDRPNLVYTDEPAPEPEVKRIDIECKLSEIIDKFDESQETTIRKHLNIHPDIIGNDEIMREIGSGVAIIIR